MGKDHSGPIIESKRPAPPGMRRELVFVVVIVGFLLAVGAIAAFVLGSRKSGYTLVGYSSAVAERKTIDDLTEVTGSIEMGTKRYVLAPEEGTVVELLFDAGQSVKAGTVVARVSAPDLSDSLATAQSDYDSTLRSLDRTTADRAFARQKEAIDLKAKADALATAQASYREAVQLVSLGTSSQKDADTAKKAADDAQSALDLATLTDDYNEKSYAYDMADLQAKRDELRKSIADYKERIASLEVKAPISGKILAWSAAPGDVVARYAQLASVADTSKPQAVFQVPEATAPKLAVGMGVAITVGTGSYTGRLSAIGLAATASTTYGTTVDATASFDSPPGDLSEGVTAAGEIKLGSKADAVVLPRGPWLSSGGNRWVYVIRGAEADRVAATFGVTEATEIEVLTGVSAGDRVIVSDYGPFVDFEKITLGGAK